MQVLIIEDNEDDYLLVQHIVLKIRDVQVKWRDSVEEGLTYLDSHPVDLLLLDLSLPDGSGLTVLDRVQSRFPALPIIILSGDETDDLAFEAIRHGAQDYLVKGQIDGVTLGRSLRYAVERKRLQEQLRQSEELYRTFARNFPNGALILYDHDLRYTLIDGLGMSDVGLSKAGMEGKTLYEIMPPEAVALAEPRLRAALAGETFQQEVDYAGQTLQVNYVPIRDSSGTILGGMMMTQNTSERKQVEEALRTSEEQFRSAFDNAAIGMALVALDGSWLQVNRALCGIIGYSEPELLTKTFQDITHPDDLDIDLRYVAQLLAGEIESYQMEKRYFHKRGHEVWVLLNGSLVRDRQGQPLHFIAQIQDITQRKTAAAALAAERNMLRTLIDNLPDYVFVKDAAGRFVVSNEAHTRASAKTIEAVMGKTSLEVFPQELADQYYADDLAVIQSGQPLINAERRTPDPSGQVKWGLTTKVPLRDADGRVTGVIGITRDITERKRAEQQALELANERERVHILSDFVRDTSHDFRTPLSTISTSLYILSKSTDPERRQASLATAERQIARLTALIDRLLVMARLDSETAFTLQRVDLNRLVASFCTQLSFNAQGKKIAVLSSLWESGLAVQANANELNLALAELGNNALRYTPGDGRITIRTTRQENQAVIEVADSGNGIPADELPKIFQRLYRVDKARASETGGAGLGLSIARRIIELHHGSITADSVVGQGSVFRVVLPLSD